MKSNYNRLWKTLIHKNMNKTDLKNYVNLDLRTVAKLSENETFSIPLHTETCKHFNCEIEEIITTENEKGDESDA